MKRLSEILDTIFPSRVRHREIKEKWHVATDQLVIALNLMTPTQRKVFSDAIRKEPALKSLDLSGMRLCTYLDVTTESKKRKP